ncbi:cardioacceleratory peptide receptor, putative [Ixodes scapularis]|uniref:Cardioacceleratory peptide receptor, putative n=1 Tax=Ixodes scapularis TaxID=6945 RepID=B7P5U5_IXOSC|nr:cardioacceleratory peptide receptor, putative [Ixodes scapularis]|eukprot:XP_002407935.1 cardioacceleratory peptide receptor, putative [Ixodes scapularis]
MSVPAVFLSREALVRGRLQCWIELELWQWQLYMTLVACSLFFVPALVITACYSVIVYTIWTKSKILSYPKLPSVGLCNCLAERLCGWWPSTPRRSWREQTVSRPSECSTMTESLQQQQRSSTRLQLRQHRRGTLLRSTDSTDAHVRNSHV